MVAFSGSVADAVAMVVPVEMFSAKELAARVVDKVSDSFISPTLKASSSVVLLVPSEAVKVKLSEVVLS